MAAWGKKILTAIGLEAEDSYDEADEREDERPRGGRYYDAEDEYEQRARGRSSGERYESTRAKDRKDYRERESREERPERGYSDFDREDYGRDSARRPSGGNREGGNVVQFRNMSSPSIRHYTEVINMRGYDDARTVIDNLIEERSVNINLEYVDVEMSQRIVDTLAGAIYALNATMTKTGMNSYLLAPASVEVVGSYDMGDEPPPRKSGGFFGGHK